jgi:hypothetical protein
MLTMAPASARICARPTCRLAPSAQSIVVAGDLRLRRLC